MKPGNQKRYLQQPASDLDYVEELSAYIERHLGESLDAGMLADRGFVSRGKLYRDFLNATGHPVREYIRKRRLSNALALLQSSGLPPASIAYECGYSSQQAMCRSIQASLGMTPGQYRQSDRCYFFPPYRGGAIYDVSARRLSLPKLYGIKFFHRSLAGIENRALALLFKRVPDFSGRLFGKNGPQKGALFCYELYVSEYRVCRQLLLLRQNEAAEGSFSKGPDLPESAGLFALVRADNREADISAAWNYLCKSWLPGSMYKQDESGYLEEYRISNLRAGSLTLMLPIRPGRAYPKISIERLPEQSFLVAEGTGPHAEKRAAETIARCLAAYRPEELRNIREFYLQKQAICAAIPRGQHIQHSRERVLCGVRADEMHADKMCAGKTANDWEARINGRESQINGKGSQINGREVQINGKEIQINSRETGNIRLARHEEGYYIVLRGHTLAEFHVYQELFTSFAAQNGLKLAGDSMFGIYRTDDGFQNPRLDFYGKVTLRDPGQNNDSGQNNHRGATSSFGTK